MKRYIPAVLICIAMVMLLAPLLYSAPGQLQRETGYRSVEIQAFSGIPVTASSQLMTGTKAFKNISSSGNYRAIRTSCTDGAGTNLPCRYSYNGSATYLPITSGERTIILNSDITYIRFGKYSSSTSSSVTLSTEKM